MYKEYVVCTNTSCKFSKVGNEASMSGCPMCGSDLLYQCPACGERIQERYALYCRKCRKPLKPQLEKN